MGSDAMVVPVRAVSVEFLLDSSAADILVVIFGMTF
jgi:hypothetical protein